MPESERVRVAFTTNVGRSRYRLVRFLSMCRTHRKLFGETYWRTSWKDSR